MVHDVTAEPLPQRGAELTIHAWPDELEPGAVEANCDVDPADARDDGDQQVGPGAQRPLPWIPVPARPNECRLGPLADEREEVRQDPGGAVRSARAEVVAGEVQVPVEQR